VPHYNIYEFIYYVSVPHLHDLIKIYYKMILTININKILKNKNNLNFISNTPPKVQNIST